MRYDKSSAGRSPSIFSLTTNELRQAAHEAADYIRQRYDNPMYRINIEEAAIRYSYYLSEIAEREGRMTDIRPIPYFDIDNDPPGLERKYRAQIETLIQEALHA